MEVFAEDGVHQQNVSTACLAFGLYGNAKQHGCGDMREPQDREDRYIGVITREKDAMSLFVGAYSLAFAALR